MNKTKIFCLLLLLGTWGLYAGPLYNTGSIDRSPVKISAENFEVDISSNYFIANDNIHVNQGDLDIWADRATYRDKKERINLYDNVHLTFKDIVIDCGYMIYNRKDYTITARKDLIVTYIDYTITSDVLIYDIFDSKVMFSGPTTIRRDSNVINGKDIVLDIVKKKISSMETTRFVLDEGIK